MKILIFGGTGSIGTSLVNDLSKNDDNQIYVTSRSKRKNFNNVNYICGNAKDNIFLNKILLDKYDVIIDFMVYSTKEFENRVDLLLENTSQYVFFSSARCFANSDSQIKEDSLRLIDSNEKEYILTDEYGVSKGREEDILNKHSKKNYTIIRPYITYNSYRLQLGVYEKENWLRRALEGKTVIFPKDIASKYTTLTYGDDVANILISLIGNKKALGQSFNITTNESHTWGEILEYYKDIVKKITGKDIKVKYVENSTELCKVWNQYQIKYDRLYNRSFDNEKIVSFIGEYRFKKTYDGLKESIVAFLNNPKWINENQFFEAWCDYQAKEMTSLNKIKGLKNKISYLKNYFLFYFKSKRK